MIIADAVLRRIRDAAATSPMQEICGLLTGDGASIHAAIPSPNRHPDPARGFAICDAVYATAQRNARAQGQTVLGCYHSHPSGETAPSETDMLAVQEDGFLWLILAPDGAFQVWRALSRGATKGFTPVAAKANAGPLHEANA